MTRPGLWLVGLGVFCLAGSFATADEAVTTKNASANPPPALSPAELAERIDVLVAARWKEAGITPAPQAGDGEFLRRLSLDMIGRIPSVREVRDFLEDTSANKRSKAVDRMLESPLYAGHFTNVWRDLMVPQNNNQFASTFGNQLEIWLRARLRENTSYDALVREVLTAPLTNQRPQGGQMAATPLAFYQANEMKPENLAAATSRLFLGVKLECAQCHDHPFASWTREQFWQYAAFFSPLQAPGQQRANPYVLGQEAKDRREIAIPGTEQTVQARFLDGKEPAWKRETSTRETLAEWVTSERNPYFARALVNRMWAHFFGIGIVDPVDEESADNPPSHPELLGELTRQFVLHRHDMRYLIRAITLSKTYQLSSAHPAQEPPDLRLLARMPIKGLTAEQLFDSVVEATGYRSAPRPGQQPVVFGQAGVQAEFLARFSNHSDKRTEFQTSILQALSLMNGQFVADATSPERSVTLAVALDAPFLDTRGKIETLYLAALSREPRSEELTRLVSYVERGGPSGDPKKALADVFWALLNSSEFILNH